MVTNLVGTMYWMSAGLLEGTLRALEHEKEKEEERINQKSGQHHEEMKSLQQELQDVIEPAETFEKEALSA